MKKKEKLLNLANAHLPHQRKQMEEVSRRGVCLFCRKHLREYHVSPTVREGKHWLVTPNDYPYEGTTLHLMLISKKHITKASQITSGMMQELGKHLSWIERKFKVPGGAFVMRFGSILYTGASVSHLHAHLVVGGKQTGRTGKIQIKIGFKKK
ncbi:HIT domain-containing protein [Patescibacteria group bacterium]|nr:MAG: HIT domain-containing protein [Patescibacteria group bacterium]